MKNKVKIYLIGILPVMLIVTGWAKEQKSEYEDFERFSTYYYLNPAPDQATKMLKNFLESEFLTSNEFCDEHCQDITAYLFARIALSEPDLDLAENCLSLFENGTHLQRLFLLKIIQLCGNEGVEKFFNSKLAAGRFINERRQIEWMLKEGIPIEFNPLTKAVTKAGDLDFLWAEFMITGSKDAVVKIIESLDQDSFSTESFLLAGAAKWSLGSNCEIHKRVFEICKQELSKANGTIKNVLQEIIVEFEKSGAGHQSVKANKERLEARAKELLKKDNVSLREDVDELFSLADIYADEGDDEKAIALYQKALAINSWRLEYQLKLAQLFKKHGDKNQAVDKAKVVYQHAEDENLIQNAESLLEELGTKLSTETKVGEHQIVDNVEIIIVPVGKINKRLLNEVKENLQKKMGIKYSISEMQLDVGKIDRSYADKYLAGMVEHIKSKLPQKNIQQLLSELTLKETDLESYDGRVKFADGFLRKIGSSQQEIKKFHNNLKKWESSGQHNALRLRAELKNRFKIPRGSSVKGYLGIVEKDIFAKDFNFLYGWGGMGYSVMSYHRFKADFNDELPDRKRLRKRFVKQGISSSFFILGIPRCTTPTCARAYPHNLKEHDQKGIEICSSCRKQLNSIIDRN